MPKWPGKTMRNITKLKGQQLRLPINLLSFYFKAIQITAWKQILRSIFGQMLRLLSSRCFIGSFHVKSTRYSTAGSRYIIISNMVLCHTLYSVTCTQFFFFYYILCFFFFCLNQSGTSYSMSCTSWRSRVHFLPALISCGNPFRKDFFEHSI